MKRTLEFNPPAKYPSNIKSSGRSQILKGKPKLNLGLTAFDELFMDEEERASSKLPKLYNIPLSLIDDFPDHPFKVRMDEDMDQLVESIKEYGLITPVILRTKELGRYEMISGHRRKVACIRAGLTTITAEIRELTQDEAIILMVDSNLQRTAVLPSEKAFSYKMRLEALKRQGKRTDLTSNPLGGKLTETAGIIGKNANDSATQVRRYIRLTELLPELLEFVDDGKMALRPAVELSYLTQEEQESVLDQIYNFECMPSHAQTIRMRKLSQRGELDDRAVSKIMKEEKPNQADRIRIPYNEIRQYIPRSVSYEKTADYIKSALIYYQQHHSESSS